MSAGFLLDTNVTSETLRPVPHPRVTARVEAQSDIEFLSVVSIGELRRGATLLVQGSARRQAAGKPLAIADGMTAATAISSILGRPN